MKRTALLIDGGHFRVSSKQAGHFPNPDFIEEFAHHCIDETHEDLYRVFYYDCYPPEISCKKPISEEEFFKHDSKWLDTLASRPYFAVRKGELQFRGWKLKNKKHIPKNRALVDDDFDLDLKQKGVDMRIGLDIASMAHACIVSRLVLVANDADFIPAMKYGRSRGLQIVLVILPNEAGKKDHRLLAHADILREVSWPEPRSVR